MRPQNGDLLYKITRGDGRPGLCKYVHTYYTGTTMPQPDPLRKAYPSACLPHNPASAKIGIPCIPHTLAVTNSKVMYVNSRGRYLPRGSLPAGFQYSKLKEPAPDLSGHCVQTMLFFFATTVTCGPSSVVLPAWGHAFQIHKKVIRTIFLSAAPILSNFRRLDSSRRLRGCMIEVSLSH